MFTLGEPRLVQRKKKHTKPRNHPHTTTTVRTKTTAPQSADPCDSCQEVYIVHPTAHSVPPLVYHIPVRHHAPQTDPLPQCLVSKIPVGFPCPRASNLHHRDAWSPASPIGLSRPRAPTCGRTKVYIAETHAFPPLGWSTASACVTAR